MGATLRIVKHEFLIFFFDILPYSVGTASADTRDIKGEPTVPPEEPRVWWGKKQVGNDNGVKERKHLERAVGALAWAPLGWACVLGNTD